MKKFLYVCLLSVVGTSMGFAITPPSTDPVKEGEKPKTEVVAEAPKVVEESNAGEGVYCSIPLEGGGNAVCWFCNCAKFAANL